MEKKAAKAKNKFLKFLPRAASAVTFQNPPFSPDKKRSEHSTGNKLKTYAGNKGFSGPLIPMIPAEARRKSKNSSFENPEVPEPISPKVSCMGQIKHKNKIKKDKKSSLPKQDFKPVLNDFPSKKKQPSLFRTVSMITGAKPPGRKSDASADKPRLLPDRAPSLSQMKRFASGRESVINFDWEADLVSPAGGYQPDYYFDEENEREEREVIIPFSAPILVGGGGGGGGGALEGRKEINLWKRRTMAQPRPLQVNTLVRSR
ncbi:hypothetical protein U1Q18_042181 [Sarracenia purpurea var. burkii]